MTDQRQSGLIHLFDKNIKGYDGYFYIGTSTASSPAYANDGSVNMIGMLTGTVLMVGSGEAIIDIGGVGYLAQCGRQNAVQPLCGRERDFAN